ncbi:hypothetical protein BN1723_014309, partial [Verticillium longisporum]
MTYCLAHLQHQDNPLLRQWACLCLSQLWNDLPEAKWRGIRENAPSQLSVLTKDRCPEVRAAMLHAMTTFIGIIDLTDEVARVEESIAWTLLDMANDGSPMVRREFLVFLSHFILRFESKFIVAAVEQLQEEKEYLLFPPEIDGVDPESQGIKEYVDVFRSVGVPPHGGGGIGLDRVVAWFLNLPSVHLASYYPRTPKRLLP